MKPATIQLVFDLGEYEPRKSGNQNAFEKNPGCIEIMEAFADIVFLAHRETREHFAAVPPLEIGRNDFSNMLNSKISGRMYTYFEQYRKRRRGRKYLRVEGYQIYFKQLYSRNHLPQHGPSESAFALEMNLQHKYDRSKDAVIWMGWQLAPDRSNIIGVYATHQNENECWHTDILDLLASNNIKKMDVEPVTAVDPKLKKKKKKQNEV